MNHEEQKFNPEVSEADSLAMADANSGKNAKRLASLVRAKNSELSALTKERDELAAQLKTIRAEERAKVYRKIYSEIDCWEQHGGALKGFVEYLRAKAARDGK